MAWKARVDVRLATQVLLLQIAVVVLTLGIAGGLLAFFSHPRIAAETGTRALDVARVVAYAPAVRADVARYDNAPLTPSATLTNELAGGQLQLIASEVQKRTDVLFVVITNNQGIRFAHPDRDELGRHVSTDPTQPLAGREWSGWDPRTRESPRPTAGFESSGGRDQRRHLDVGDSSAAVD